jgi:hypothetical protein
MFMSDPTNAATLTRGLALIIFLFVTVVAQPRVVSDKGANLVLSTNPTCNVSVVANALLLNGDPVATTTEAMRIVDDMQDLRGVMAALVAQFSTALSEMSASLADAEARLAVLEPYVEHACASLSTVMPVVQQFGVSGGFGWEYFEVQNTSFLALSTASTVMGNTSLFRHDRSLPAGAQWVVDQQFPMLGLSHWRAFDIPASTGAGTFGTPTATAHFLAVADPNGGSTAVYSLNTSRARGAQWTVEQTDGFTMSSFVEHFSMPSGLSPTLTNATREHFLVFTANADVLPASTQSTIFKYNPERAVGTRWVLDQKLDTGNAAMAKYFAINGTSFLAIANEYVSREQQQANSSVFRYDPTRAAGARWVLDQALPTTGALAVDAVTVSDGPNATTTFLVFANSKTTLNDHVSNSTIYRFEPTRPRGVQWVVEQHIVTSSAAAMRFFTLRQTAFLAVANARSVIAGDQPVSKIYAFNAARSAGARWLEVQSVPTSEPQGLAFFTMHGQPYLAVANAAGNTAAQLSVLYQLDEQAIDACWLG